MEESNQTWGLLDELSEAIQPGSSISICSSDFSIYAYQALQDQLESCASCRFLYLPMASAVKKTEQENKRRRVSQDHSIDGLLGTEGELADHPELTQMALSKVCHRWLQKKGQFRMLEGAARRAHFILITPPKHHGFPLVYTHLRTFTMDTLGSAQLRTDQAPDDNAEDESDGVVRFYAGKKAERYQKVFDQMWGDPTGADIKDGVLQTLQMAASETAPELVYFRTLYQLFRDFSMGVATGSIVDRSDEIARSAAWNILFSFQRDAAIAIISKLEQYNGCILADSVGLGKTYTALAVIQYYEKQGEKVLVLCPKRLRGNWLAFRSRSSSNPLLADHLSYDVLYHTDLLRVKGKTDTGKPIEDIDWGSYSLVVIDESHNFRTGIDKMRKKKRKPNERKKENRYSMLKKHILEEGVETKVLMLTATPVNTSFRDLRNQFALVFRNPRGEFAERLHIRGTLTGVFTAAQRAYNAWQKEEDRSMAALADKMNPSFYMVMDAMSIARSRRQIQQFYDVSKLGPFPEKLPPISMRPPLVRGKGKIGYDMLYNTLAHLSMAAYGAGSFIYPDKKDKYKDSHGNLKFTVIRMLGVQLLMAILVMKRLESSVHAFVLTVTRVIQYMRETMDQIDRFLESGEGAVGVAEAKEVQEDEEEDDSDDVITISSNQLDLHDVDCEVWREFIRFDVEALEDILPKVRAITPEKDNKLQTLMDLIRKKTQHPFNEGNRKVLIFTAYADTAKYLYPHISEMAKNELGLNTAMITGSDAARSTVPGLAGNSDRILASFSPLSTERDVNYPRDKQEIDILIATDCVSEGQNLQDCDYCINYDIHWNPVRIIQRFGRVDRIGSHNKVIQLVNYWPDVDLDVYLNLKTRVENRMKAAVLAATGDDNPIEQEEDLAAKREEEYRKNQLRQIVSELPDEDQVTGGVQTAELTMSEYHTDIVAHMGEYWDIDSMPSGLYAVTKGEVPGVIFVFRHRHPNRYADLMNRFNPYYLVYVRDDGTILYDHLHGDQTLYAMRLYSVERKKPDQRLCAELDRETRRRTDMSRIGALLQAAMDSVVQVQRESMITSLFRSGGTTFLSAKITSPADLELEQYLVVR